MFRVTALLLIALAMQTPAIAQEEPKPDTVQVHGKPLTLSCAEWKRNPDGSWASTGPLLVGTDTVNNATLRGKDANVLETKCGSGAAPAAKPPATVDPTKHAGHRHHGAAPSDGT
jgi:hypothetical protein